MEKNDENYLIIKAEHVSDERRRLLKAADWWTIWARNETGADTVHGCRILIGCSDAR